MPDSVTVKLAVAVVGGHEIEVTHIDGDTYQVGPSGSDLSYPVKGYDAALLEADAVAAKVAAIRTAIKDAEDFVAAKRPTPPPPPAGPPGGGPPGQV